MSDINAFHDIFLTGKRAMWEIAVSPKVYQEVMATPEMKRLIELSDWFNEVYTYWIEILNDDPNIPTANEARKHKSALLSSGNLNILPDTADRELICDAIIYRCDTFCTRDMRTIVRKRDQITNLPLKIVTPSEWWNLIEPFGNLWA